MVAGLSALNTEPFTGEFAEDIDGSSAIFSVGYDAEAKHLTLSLDELNFKDMKEMPKSAIQQAQIYRLNRIDFSDAAE